MPSYKLTINGQAHTVEADPEMPLLWAIRDLVGLTGTKFGCGIGMCGACTILLGKEAKKSCQMMVSEVGNEHITTIEGLGNGKLHPLQKAWMDLDVPQCGYCQAGQIMRAAALLIKTPRPTAQQIDEAMNDNLCRCGTYLRIREAVAKAAGGAK